MLRTPINFGNPIDPVLQQKLDEFDHSTQKDFALLIQKQTEELNAFDRQWLYDHEKDLSITSRYLDVRNVEAREKLQNKNALLIRKRNRARSEFQRQQKEKLQEFFNQKTQERNEIISTSDFSPSSTIMTIYRNKSGVKITPQQKKSSKPASSLSTKSVTINNNSNHMRTFKFSKNRFENKEITVGRFKKKNPKKKENDNLLDLNNLSRILNQKDGKIRRFQDEKHFERTIGFNQLGDLASRSGTSSAFISAQPSDFNEDMTLRMSNTNPEFSSNASFRISTNSSLYYKKPVADRHLDKFMRMNEETDKEIDDFIMKQDQLIQQQINSFDFSATELKTDNKTETPFSDNYQTENPIESSLMDKINQLINSVDDDSTESKLEFQEETIENSILKPVQPADVVVNIFTTGMSSSTSTDNSDTDD